MRGKGLFNGQRRDGVGIEFIRTARQLKPPMTYREISRRLEISETRAQQISKKDANQIRGGAEWAARNLVMRGNLHRKLPPLARAALEGLRHG